MFFRGNSADCSSAQLPKFWVLRNIVVIPVTQTGLDCNLRSLPHMQNLHVRCQVDVSFVKKLRPHITWHEKIFSPICALSLSLPCFQCIVLPTNNGWNYSSSTRVYTSVVHTYIFFIMFCRWPKWEYNGFPESHCLCRSRSIHVTQAISNALNIAYARINRSTESGEQVLWKIAG